MVYGCREIRVSDGRVEVWQQATGKARQRQKTLLLNHEHEEEKGQTGNGGEILAVKAHLHSHTSSKKAVSPKSSQIEPPPGTKIQACELMEGVLIQTPT